MKINNNNVIRPAPLDSAKGSKVASDRSTSSIAADVKVELSQSHLGPEQIDRARVDEVRAAIIEGRLEINPEQIAEGLISDTLAFLGAAE